MGYPVLPVFVCLYVFVQRHPFYMFLKEYSSLLWIEEAQCSSISHFKEDNNSTLYLLTALQFKKHFSHRLPHLKFFYFFFYYGNSI